MVISYNQNLHLYIHCKKLLKQDYNSFCHILIFKKNSHNDMIIEFTVKVFAFLYY